MEKNKNKKKPNKKTTDNYILYTYNTNTQHLPNNAQTTPSTSNPHPANPPTGLYSST